MILLGFIGIYVGMIFQEVKRRPLFILRTVTARKQSQPMKTEILEVPDQQ
jgi:hypothetical protein